MKILAMVLGTIIASVFLFSGISKLLNKGLSVELTKKFSIDPNTFLLIGLAEVFGSIGILLSSYVDTGELEWISFFAAMGLITLMFGALWYHYRAKDEIKNYLPAIFLLVMCVLYIFAVANR